MLLTLLKFFQKNATKSKKTNVVKKKKITDDNHNNIESAGPTDPVQSSVKTPVHKVHKETAAALHQISSKKWKHKQNGEASKSEVKKVLNVDDNDFVVEKVARNVAELSHKTRKKKSKSENEDALKGVESLMISPGNKEDHIEESSSQQLSQKTPKKKLKIGQEHSSENVGLSQESSLKSPEKKLRASQDIFEEVADESSDDLQLAQKSPKKKRKSVENLLEAVEEISPKKKSKKQRKGKGADADSQLENSYISVTNSDHGNQSSQVLYIFHMAEMNFMHLTLIFEHKYFSFVFFHHYLFNQISCYVSWVSAGQSQAAFCVSKGRSEVWVQAQLMACISFDKKFASIINGVEFLVLDN